MINFERFATEVWVIGRLDPVKYGLVYRTGKDEKDVIKARFLTRKKSHPKTESEIDLLATYLKKIFKAAK